MIEPWREKIKYLTKRSYLIVGISLSGDDIQTLRSLRWAQKIWVRDYETLRLAQEAQCNAEWAPDLAILISGDAEAGRMAVQKAFEEEGWEGPKEYFVLAPLGYWLNPIQKDILWAYVDLVKQSPLPIVLVAASTRNPDDRAACYYIKELAEAEKKGKCIVAPRRFLPDIIAGASGVVTSRLHVGITAIACGVPMVAWSDHRKIKTAMAALECSTQVLPTTASAKEVLSSLRLPSISVSSLKNQAQLSLAEAFASFTE